jgi:hypothetical protein
MVSKKLTVTASASHNALSVSSAEIFAVLLEL